MSELDDVVAEEMHEEAVVSDAPVAETIAVPVRRKRSMFQDPMVRAMALAAGLLAILYLAGIVSALFFGVIQVKPLARTASERKLAVAEQAMQAGDVNDMTVANYAYGLMEVGRYGRAQRVLDDYSEIKPTRGAEMQFAQARLYLAQEKYEDAIKQADKAIAIIKKTYDTEMKSKKLTESRAYGIHDNYSEAILLKAAAYREMKQWKKALEQYNAYVELKPTAADVLADRGYVKIELNDKKGAEKDFKQTLKFIPDDKRALDGLKKIGAAK